MRTGSLVNTQASFVYKLLILGKLVALKALNLNTVLNTNIRPIIKSLLLFLHKSKIILYI